MSVVEMARDGFEIGSWDAIWNLLFVAKIGVAFVLYRKTHLDGTLGLTFGLSLGLLQKITGNVASARVTEIWNSTAGHEVPGWFHFVGIGLMILMIASWAFVAIGFFRLFRDIAARLDASTMPVSTDVTVG